MNENIRTLAINTIRTLSIDAANRANSGHPGLLMGAAPMAYALWANHMRHNPDHAAWFNRDRFVLSAGHGSTLLYSLLHLTGYDVTIDDLRSFRKLHSKTPGHPEFGQAEYPVIDHCTCALAGDGDLMEGVSYALCGTERKSDIDRYVRSFRTRR